MNSVNILFLSDLHFTRKNVKHAENYARDIEECAKSYIDAIGRLDKEWKPKIIAIAGDIGYYGAAEDYQFFKEKFLLPLMEKLEISADHIIMCPGNHDKDDSHLPIRSNTTAKVGWCDVKKIEASELKTVEGGIETFYTGYRADCNMQRFVLDEYSVKPFNNYIHFLKEMGIPAFDITKYDYDRDDIQTDDCEYLYGYRNIDGIDFYCYNSAWDCFHNDKNDKGNLRIGPVKKREVTTDYHKLIISLIHHPHDWLSIEAVSSIKFKSTVIMDESTIAVHGHMHTANVYQDENGQTLFVQLPTWSSPDTDFERWKSYIFKINIDDFSYSRMSFFWHRDNGYACAAIADGKETHPLKMTQKIESYEEMLFRSLAIHYKSLSYFLEKFIGHPSRDSFYNIADLLKIIAEVISEIAGIIDINKPIMSSTIKFYKEVSKVMEPEKPEDLTHDDLINSAKELQNSIAQGDYIVRKLRKGD